MKAMPRTVIQTDGADTATTAKEIAMPVHLTCSICEQPFVRKPHAAPNARFCSRRCQGAAIVKPFPDYVWDKIDQSGGPDACWPWTGGRDNDGYGVTHVGKKYAKAHRVILELKLGRLLLPGMMACHDCPGGEDHPWCCNPAHLWEGTAKANAQDAAAKQRTLLGERNTNARFTEDDIRYIRAALMGAKKGTQARLARQYGVNRTTLERIKNRQTWQHVT